MRSTNLQKERAIQYDDLFDIKGVASPAFSPDNLHIACVISSPEKKENAFKDEVVIINILTKEIEKVAIGSSPQWSPDGNLLAFQSAENDLSGIWIYNMKSHSKSFLVPIYYSDYFIDHYANYNFCWSPDGESIAYVSSASNQEINKKEETRVFTHLLYKTKGGRGRPLYADHCRVHIWLISVKENTPQLLTDGNYNEHSVSFSPDGHNICFVSNHSGLPDLNQWNGLYMLDIFTRDEKRISAEKATAFQPAWSPDGRFIAWLAISGEISTNDSPAEDSQLFVFSIEGGMKPYCLTSGLDRRVEQISWAGTSKSVFFTAGDSGSVYLYRVDVETEEIETIIKQEGKILEYSLSGDGIKVAFTHTDTTHPADIFLYDLKTKQSVPLTSFNSSLSDSCQFVTAKTFWFKSFDDTKVQAWIMKPFHFNSAEKYPLILVIHGGPHNMFGYEFEDRMQILAANGYGVLFMNPRGSSGYGQDFSNGTLYAWGEGDFKDLMSGVDEAISNNDWIDPERLGVTGQSYGGYMTNRIITKTTRFKAAVADGSICNLISFAGTSLYHSLMESEFQGEVYDNFEALWNCSPLKEVRNVKTPVLFFHGETDNEVPVTQADEMFVAVRKQGVDTAFVQYIGEGHGWRPDLPTGTRIDLLTRMIQWFDQYLKDDHQENIN